MTGWIITKIIPKSNETLSNAFHSFHDIKLKNFSKNNNYQRFLTVDNKIFASKPNQDLPTIIKAGNSKGQNYQGRSIMNLMLIYSIIQMYIQNRKYMYTAAGP